MAATEIALATGLGAIPVFGLGTRTAALQPLLLGIAAGTMTVASVAGLIISGLDEGSAGSVGTGLAAGRKRRSPRSAPTTGPCPFVTHSLRWADAGTSGYFQAS